MRLFLLLKVTGMSARDVICAVSCFSIKNNHMLENKNKAKQKQITQLRKQPPQNTKTQELLVVRYCRSLMRC